MSGMFSVAEASAAATPPSSRRPAKNPSSASASSWRRDERNSLMSRAHGLDRTSRQETTKAAARASISERRRRSQATTQWSCCCYGQNRINNSPFIFSAAFFRRPIGGAVRVTRWNPLCERKEKRKRSERRGKND
uniref:Uncharacterized protein n=1 Tax=Arundo donax TaxID=35708 RepID=A0A0A9HDV5_ARUDO